MPNLLEKLRSIREAKETQEVQSTESDHQELTQIAIRELTSKSKRNDAERLAEVLESLDWSEDDYVTHRDNISDVCRLIGRKEFNDTHGDDIEATGEALSRKADAADAIRLQLTLASVAVRGLTRDASRINSRLSEVKHKFSGMFDADGEPLDALRPVIQLTVDEQNDRRQENTKAANEALKAASKLPE